MQKEVGDEGRVEELLGVLPERVPCMVLVAGGVLDEALHEAQRRRLAVDVGDGVEVHGACEVYGVECLDLVAEPFEDVAHVVDERALGVGDEVVGVTLHEVRLHEVARLSRAGAAYDEHVVVRLGPLVVGGIDEADARPLGEDDVVVGVLPIRVRLDLLRRRP